MEFCIQCYRKIYRLSGSFRGVEGDLSGVAETFIVGNEFYCWACLNRNGVWVGDEGEPVLRTPPDYLLLDQ